MDQYMIDKERIGRRLKAVRVERGETREEMAEHAGVSVDTIKRLEQGNLGRVDSLLLVAQAYHLSLDQLFFTGTARRLHTSPSSTAFCWTGP